MAGRKALGELPVARLLASDFCLFASGEHRVAGGDKIKVTRREASDWALTNFVS